MSNNSLISLFDYIFYRIYRFFKERGDLSPETAASLLLSLMQCLTLVDIDVFIERFFNYTFFPSKYAMLIPLIVVGGINQYRYEYSNFDISKLEARWGNEGRGRMIRNGWLIGLYLLVSFLIPAVYGYLKHNLKVI